MESPPYAEDGKAPVNGYYDYHPQVQLRCPLALVGLTTEPAQKLGHWLASTEGLPLIELDRRIEHAAGCSIWALVGLDGEARYRELEHTALETAVHASPPGVIVCGDGVALSAENRALLSAYTHWVGLSASLPSVVRSLQQVMRAATGFWHPTRREVLMNPTQVSGYRDARIEAMRSAATIIDLDAEDARSRRRRLRAELPELS